MNNELDVAYSRYCSVLPGETEENSENIGEYSRSSARHLSLGTAEYNAGMLTSRPVWSVT
jgi:hypothetical protein